MKHTNTLIVTILALIAIIIAIVLITKRPVDMPAPEVAAGPTQETLCYYGELQGAQGLKDVAWTRLEIDGENVSGEFRNIPAEKDSKMGTFIGTVTPASASRMANVWWKSQAEGMTVMEELSISLNDQSAQALYGEMVDRGDGTYGYKDKNNLTPGISMAKVTCNVLAEKVGATQ